MPRPTCSAGGRPAAVSGSSTRTWRLPALAIVLAWVICVVLGRLGAPDHRRHTPRPIEPPQVTLQQRG
ncbi:MAG: hypothetical protein IID33_02120 [Planctomycetes bacterium]|nr:hypothetical protein [Planctomycetota bacterium]